MEEGNKKFLLRQKKRSSSLLLTLLFRRRTEKWNKTFFQFASSECIFIFISIFLLHRIHVIIRVFSLLFVALLCTFHIFRYKLMMSISLLLFVSTTYVALKFAWNFVGRSLRNFSHLTSLWKMIDRGGGIKISCVTSVSNEVKEGGFSVFVSKEKLCLTKTIFAIARVGNALSLTHLAVYDPVRFFRTGRGKKNYSKPGNFCSNYCTWKSETLLIDLPFFIRNCFLFPSVFLGEEKRVNI